MPFVPANDGVLLHFRSEGRGRPIVLVHGWTMSGRLFEPNIAGLARDHRVVTVDLRGHGRSGRDLLHLTIEQAADDLETVLDHLDLDDIVLAGWSMGGSVVYKYIEALGTGRLAAAVAIDLTPYTFTEPGWEHGLFGEFDAAACLALQNRLVSERLQVVNSFVSTMFAAGAEVPAADERVWRDESATVHDLAALSLLVSLSAQDFRPLLPRIDVPVLLAHGARSQIYPTKVWEPVAEAIPRTETVIFENSGHSPFWEERDRFNAELLAFVGRLY